MKRWLGGTVLGLLALAWCGGALGSEGVAGDAEAAKHAAAASEVRVISEETLPDFAFRQFELGVLSHYSYLLGSQGEAIIVDPARDVTAYVKTAGDLGLKIVGIYLTHSHADFVAGHTELAKITGAPIYVNKLSDVGYNHTPVTDGFEIALGNVRAVVRLTPGHTPDGTCLFVHYPAAAPEPKLCFTGDTLFIGSVGRPDLMGGAYHAAELARMIYDTWNNVLSKTPDSTAVYPAHGAGSLCGANLSTANVSTFGEQKQTNPYTKHKDLATFVMAVLDGLPTAPPYFGKNAAMNREGPPLVDWTATRPEALSPEQVAGQMDAGGWLLDVREAAEFAAGHVPGSINIPVRGRFETWTGIMIPWGAPFVLVGADDQVEEATYRLHRVGFDRPAGHLAGGVGAWTAAGRPVRTVALVSPRELYAQMQDGTAPILVDVRLPKEWMGLRVAELLLNMPIDELAGLCAKLDPAMPVMTICNSAYRSSMGASVLLKAGFKDVRNMQGGGEAWVAAGLPAYSSAGKGVVSAAPAVFLDLPESMSPQDVAQRMMDMPGSIEVVDVRPEWQYQEYHIEGAANVAPADVLNNPAFLVGKNPLVIVCRDGSVSASLGGAIVGKTERSVRFLAGGMVRYWEEIMRPAGVLSDKAMGPAVTPPVVSPPDATRPAAPVSPATPQPAPVVRRPSAGC